MRRSMSRAILFHAREASIRVFVWHVWRLVGKVRFWPFSGFGRILPWAGRARQPFEAPSLAPMAGART